MTHSLAVTRRHAHRLSSALIAALSIPLKRGTRDRVSMSRAIGWAQSLGGFVALRRYYPVAASVLSRRWLSVCDLSQYPTADKRNDTGKRREPSLRYDP